MSSFGVHASRVSFLSHPSEYLSCLKSLVGSSRRRIVMSALYLGTDAMSRSLVSACEDALNRPSPPSVSLIFDHGRALRGEGTRTSVGMCAPLAARGASIHLWKSPSITAVHDLLVPGRLKELIGVFHAKVHVFDDTVVISGANLSESYFVDRKDRYFVIRDAPELANFYCSLLSIAADASYSVRELGNFAPPRTSQSVMAERLKETLNPAKIADVDLSDDNVVVTPTCQLGCLGLRQDEEQVGVVLRETDGDLVLTSGYFNVSDDGSRRLFEAAERARTTRVIVGAPDSSAWAGSSGAAQNVPRGYNFLAAQFLRSLPSSLRLSFLEWSGPPKWSYHCKGLWYLGAVDALTIVGSANFGARSSDRDFEMQAILRSKCPSFRQMLGKEIHEIEKDCKVVGLAELEQPDRALPWQWKVLMPWMKKLM